MAFGSDQQLWYQLFEENTSIVPNQDMNLPIPDVQTPYQNAQYIPGNININLLSNQANSGASESSWITGVNSLYGGSYSQGLGLNCADSLASVSGPLYSSTLNQLYGQVQGQVRGQSRGGELARSISMPQFSVSPMMMSKRPRLETLQEESLVPNYPEQLALWQAMQLKCHNDRVLASRMFQQQQSPYQQQNVPNSKNINTRPLLPATIQPQQAVRKLMSYVHCRKQRPPDNNIDYWRSFVNHFYSPHVRKRTCFSNYDHIGRHAQGAFVPMNAWSCDLCGSTSGKGFVESFDVLPRMNQLYFSTAVIDDILYLGLPTERTLLQGFLMVRFEKAVQEIIYVDSRVVQEGKLQVIFTPELQIISWDFCIKHHEVLLPRKLIESQVNAIVKSATSCKNNADAKEQDFQSKGHSVAAVGRELARTLEQPNVGDFGYPKHFNRSLQVSEVFNSMKDMMVDSINNNTGPIETLQRYDRKTAGTKPEMRPMEYRSPVQQQTPGPSDPRNFPANDVHLAGNYMHQTPTMEYRSPVVQQTPGPSDPRNFPANDVRLAGNYMHQTPIIKKGKAVFNSPCLYQNPPVEVYPNSYRTPISPGEASLVPASMLRHPSVEQFMLNDLLAHYQREGPKRAQHENTRQNYNATYEPNGEYGAIVPGGTRMNSRIDIVDSSQMNNELSTDQVPGAKTENRKGLSSSSSSNQDCNYIKKESDLDEDFTSPSQS